MSRYRGPSEAQINAEALARRSAPYSGASDVSFRVAWDFHRREPDNLRDAVRQARRAYSDEVPDKLHDGPDAIGQDGTPRMTAKAVGYIFGSSQGSDAEREDNPLVSYYHSPFRAALDRMEHGAETERLYASIVSKVTIGGQYPAVAAIAAGVKPECLAKSVALMALRSFLRSMTDLKLHVQDVANEAVSA